MLPVQRHAISCAVSHQAKKDGAASAVATAKASLLPPKTVPGEMRPADGSSTGALNNESGLNTHDQAVRLAASHALLVLANELVASLHAPKHW